jgi:hypothetical protein
MPTKYRNRKKKGGAIYDKIYISDDTNYSKIDGTPYLLVRQDPMTKSKSTYDEDDFVLDPITLQKISRPNVYVIDDHFVFDVNSLYDWVVTRKQTVNPSTRKPFVNLNKHDLELKYLSVYLSNDVHYVLIDDTEYLIMPNVAKLEDRKYKEKDIAKDPYTKKYIKRANAFILSKIIHGRVHAFAFDIDVLYDHVVEMNDIKNPYTGANFDLEDYIAIMRGYYDYMLSIQYVYYDQHNKVIHFRDDLSENDVIFLKNNKFVFLADKLISRNNQLEVTAYHSRLHCKYATNAQSIFMIKLENVVGYCIKTDPDYQKYSGKVKNNKKVPTSQSRMLNISNYHLYEVLNIIDYFRFLNFYGKSRKYQGQIRIDHDSKHYKKLLEAQTQAPHILAMDIRMILVHFPTAPGYQTIKLSNVAKPVENALYKSYMTDEDSFAWDTDTSSKQSKPSKSLSPDSLNDLPGPELSTRSWTSRFLNYTYRLNPYSKA